MWAMFLLLSLFHHGNRDVASFVGDSTRVVQSYDDGSFSSVLEHSRIVAIRAELNYLARHPGDKHAAKLMDVIDEQLTDLKSYDDALDKASDDFQDALREN